MFLVQDQTQSMQTIFEELIADRVNSANVGFMQVLDKRLQDTASILSVPGIIAGGQNAYCEFNTFTDFVETMMKKQKHNVLGFKTVEEKFIEVGK